MLFKKKLTVNEIINKVRTTSDALLIDCRPKEEYARGHIAGAINIPTGKISEERISRRLPDKGKQLYIVGSYSDRPSEAVSKFKKLGYKKAADGGYMEEHHGLLTR